MERLVGGLHLSGMIFINIYGFFIPTHSFYDKCYLCSLVCLPFSWLLCKGECLISYLVKKAKDPKYILGENPEQVDDLISLFPSPIWYHFFYHAGHCLRVFSVVLVNERSVHVSYYIVLPCLTWYTWYTYAIFLTLHTF